MYLFEMFSGCKTKIFFKNIAKCYIRSYSVRPKFIPDENVMSAIQEEELKPKTHPGIMKPRTVLLPDSFVKSILNTVEDFPVKALLKDSVKLTNHLRHKVPPMEEDEVKSVGEKIQRKVLRRVKDMNFKNDQQFIDTVKGKFEHQMHKTIYNWQPIKYDDHSALVYLFARSAPEYAVLVKIFSEIFARHPNFKPRAIFDFGSGIGTVMWAANMFWKKDIFEYFNVDSSAEMNDLAQILLQGGKGNSNVPLRGVYFRQFLPASNSGYDLVVSAYTLLELPSAQARLQTILRLWNKTQNYLIVVEQGTNAGFKVVNEVRDFVLQLKDSEGHVFSPCPHDLICPRFLACDGTPCNFIVGYHSLPVGAVSVTKKERFSYVVLKKGKREDTDKQWPRIVRDTLVKSKHSICRICTSGGKLEEIIFTAKKHGKSMYHCARASKCGDLLPITIDNESGPIKTDPTAAIEENCDNTNQGSEVSDAPRSNTNDDTSFCNK